MMVVSETLSLFDEPEPEELPLKSSLQKRLKIYSQQNVFFGTSSWKYEGWLGQIYSADRYSTRGKLSKKKFEQLCLTEYAETFATVCGDFAFYQFPTASFWKQLFETSPKQLCFSFKVPEEVTTPALPSHPRYGARSGSVNPMFLSRSVFEDLFLQPLSLYHARAPILILEFGSVCGRLFKPSEFVEYLGKFLNGLPRTHRYAVEIRNAEILDESMYWKMLRSCGVTHVLNAWSRMPTIYEQMERYDVFTTDVTVVRALLTQGRSYEEAVRQFSPYQSIRERNPDVRRAIRDIVVRTIRRGETAYIYVNNRLEGNAPQTIHEILEPASIDDQS